MSSANKTRKPKAEKPMEEVIVDKAAEPVVEPEIAPAPVEEPTPSVDPVAEEPTVETPAVEEPKVEPTPEPKAEKPMEDKADKEKLFQDRCILLANIKFQRSQGVTEYQGKPIEKAIEELQAKLAGGK